MSSTKITVLHACLYGCIGLFLGVVWHPPSFVSVYWLGGIGTMLFVFWLAYRHLRRVIIITGFSFFICFLYAGWHTTPTSTAALPTFERGILVRDTDVRSDKTLVTVSVSNTRARISILGIFVCPMGSEITAAKPIALKRPAPFLTETGRLFSYDTYLMARGISLVGFVGTLDTLACREQKDPTFLSRLFDIKHLFLEGIRRSVPEPYASIGTGIVLGEKGSMENTLQDAFRRTSLTHILVLSGYNIMIIIVALTLMLGWIPLPVRVSIIGLFIVTFVILTGAEAATVRAALMGILALVALLTHRKQDIGITIGLVALGMGLYNPMLLTYDPGFHLSFIATLGLILFTSRLELPFLPSVLGVRTIVATTLAAQIAVLPYIIYMSGMVSVVSVLANILILPIIPLLMLCVFLTGVFSVAFPPVGLFFGYLTSLIAKLIASGVLFLSDLPFAAFIAPPVPAAAIAVFYIGSAMFLCAHLYTRAIHP